MIPYPIFLSNCPWLNCEINIWNLNPPAVSTRLTLPEGRSYFCSTICSLSTIRSRPYSIPILPELVYSLKCFQDGFTWFRHPSCKKSPENHKMKFNIYKICISYSFPQNKILFYLSLLQKQTVDMSRPPEPGRASSWVVSKHGPVTTHWDKILYLI